jgi:hypothetical protein
VPSNTCTRTTNDNLEWEDFVDYSKLINIFEVIEENVILSFFGLTHVTFFFPSMIIGRTRAYLSWGLNAPLPSFGG